MADSIDRLYDAVLVAMEAPPSSSRTARLLRAGRSKIAKKVAEEAVEVVIEAMLDHRDAVVRESADSLQSRSVVGVGRCRTERRLERNAPARALVRHCREACQAKRPNESTAQTACDGRCADTQARMNGRYPRLRLRMDFGAAAD